MLRRTRVRALLLVDAHAARRTLLGTGFNPRERRVALRRARDALLAMRAVMPMLASAGICLYHVPSSGIGGK